MNTTATNQHTTSLPVLAAPAASIAYSREEVVRTPRLPSHHTSPQAGMPRIRRGALRLATFLMVAVVSTAAMVTSAAPASAAVTYLSASCSWGNTSVTVGVVANRPISNGQQWVSVRYVVYSPHGWRIDTGYTAGFWAPMLGPAWAGRTIHTGTYKQWQTVYVNVAYWDGARWTYDPTWRETSVSGCMS